MVQLANAGNALSVNDNKNLELLYRKLPELVADEKPALIHGDLWSGNYLIGTDKPYLIDPAVCYSSRECDMAMTMLFGGFDTAFYQAYQAAYPLPPGWQQRIALYQLYPLLLHLNLFGASYLPQVRHCLAGYV